jgi:hypothetical protein
LYFNQRRLEISYLAEFRRTYTGIINIFFAQCFYFCYPVVLAGMVLLCQETKYYRLPEMPSFEPADAETGAG